ncbi:hypothetical protein TNCT_196781 [Trichonephila clavata]|uniref:Uncharacterized protein n=1 Tax=Trichonephila clavata TaxID=2740835 RepID=A0A8X6LP82_TRICU|nr:hypothetical protein TNCT_196781 [Trichonephila clavata]
MGGVDGIWPPSGHEEVPGLNDGVEFSTRSAQERVFDGEKNIICLHRRRQNDILFSCHHIFGYTDSFQFHRGPARPRIPTLF